MKRLTCILAAGLMASTAYGQAENPSKRDDPPRTVRSDKRSSKHGKLRRHSTRHLLNLRVKALELDAAPLEQVMDWLADYTGVNVVVRWEALGNIGIERDQPVSVKMRNLRLSQAMWVILNEAAGGGPTRLAYRATRDMIVISTHEDLNRNMIVKVYDVRDLLMRVPFHANTRFVREQTYVAGLQPRVAAGAVGFQPIIRTALSGVELYTDDDEGERFEDEQEGDREQAIRELIDAIVTAVEPDTWGVNGGSGAVREFNGFLIVRNTPYVHQQLAGPLSEDDEGR